jgi:hypothetical protein
MGRSEVNLTVSLRMASEGRRQEDEVEDRFAPKSHLVGFYSNARPVPTPAKLFPIDTPKGGGP